VRRQDLRQIMAMEWMGSKRSSRLATLAPKPGTEEIDNQSRMPPRHRSHQPHRPEIHLRDIDEGSHQRGRVRLIHVLNHLRMSGGKEMPDPIRQVVFGDKPNH
jgi:hypothetical protein